MSAEVPGLDQAAADFIHQVTTRVVKPGDSSPVTEGRFTVPSTEQPGLYSVWTAAPREVHLFVALPPSTPGKANPTLSLTVREAFKDQPATASFRRRHTPGLPPEAVQDLAALDAGRPLLAHLPGIT